MCWWLADGGADSTAVINRSNTGGEPLAKVDRAVGGKSAGAGVLTPAAQTKNKGELGAPESMGLFALRQLSSIGIGRFKNMQDEESPGTYASMAIAADQNRLPMTISKWDPGQTTGGHSTGPGGSPGEPDSRFTTAAGGLPLIKKSR